MKGVRQTHLAIAVASALALSAPLVWPRLSMLADSWWWPATVLSIGFFAALGVGWIQRASARSPMQFVAAVNGTTAMKLFAALGWLTAFLVTHEEGRLEYVFSTFAVFVVDTVILVVSTTRTPAQNEKN